MSDFSDPVATSHEDTLDHRTVEDAVLDHAGDRAEFYSESDRVGDRAEMGIHQEVPVVGAFITNVDGVGAQIVDPGGDDARREVEHLERCSERSEPVDELGLVNHHDEALTHLCDEFLAGMSTATALGEIEFGVDLVCAIDDDVECADVVGGDDVYSERHREFLGTDRCCSADDVEGLVAQRSDRVSDRGAGAESDAHAALDQIGRLSAGGFLRLVLGHRHGGQRTAGLAVVATAVMLFMSAALAAPAADAHGGDPFVHAEVDEVGVDGLLAGVVPGEIAQVVMVNGTGGVVEVLDDDGAPFIRFQPGSVEVDVASAAWLRTLDPAGGERHGVASDCGTHCWRTVADSPVFAWSDHRLHPAVRQVPQDLFSSGDDVVLAEWAIPLLADGDAATADVRGRIVYRPSEGFAVAGLASGLPPEGVAVTIEPGQVPAIDLEAPGESVFVRDAAGDAFVRVGDGEVAFHTGTRHWHDLARLAGVVPTSGPPVGGGDLVAIATGERFAWLDPRGAYLDDSGPDEPAVVAEWAIPYVTGSGDGEIAGQTQWIPTPDRAASGGGAGLPVPVLLAVACMTAVAVLLLLRRRRTPAE